MQCLAKFGYQVKIDGSFIPAQDAMVSPKLWNNIKLSPTKTGAFITIRSSASKEQLMQIKKQLSGKK